MNTPWKWLSVSIGIGCLMIAVGILLRGHPTTAQYEELKLRLQALESRAKAEDSGLIKRIENDAKAQVYAQVAYEGVVARIDELESKFVTVETLQKYVDLTNSNFTQGADRSKDVNAKLKTLFELITKSNERVDIHDKYLRQLDKNLRK